MSIKQISNRSAATKFILNSMGEAGMGGAQIFGLTIETPKGVINLLEKKIIFVSPDETEAKKKIFADETNTFYVIEGEFFTYIFNSESEEFSIYKATIRGENGVWCAENPILGEKVYHINSHNQHYYIQFPFVRYSEFDAVWNTYEQKRLEQIHHLKSYAKL